MDDHLDISLVFMIRKFDKAGLTCNSVAGDKNYTKTLVIMCGSRVGGTAGPDPPPEKSQKSTVS